jgi:hypothetical protein
VRAIFGSELASSDHDIAAGKSLAFACGRGG